MEFYEAKERRRTVRDFDGTPIDDAALERIISAGMRAPTNDHMRDWHFIVVKDAEVVGQLLKNSKNLFR